jgi:hypothetical protein
MSHLLWFEVNPFNSFAINVQLMLLVRAIREDENLLETGPRNGKFLGLNPVSYRLSSNLFPNLIFV